MYLVDTNIISLTAPGRPAGAPFAARWIRQHTASLFLSVMTIAEIEQGIQRLRRTGATRKAAELTTWLKTVLLLYQSRLLPFDISVAIVLGRMADHAVGSGRPAEAADLIIAATAQSRGYTVVTRNVRHFAGLGVPVLDPYEPSPGAPP